MGIEQLSVPTTENWRMPVTPVPERTALYFATGTPDIAEAAEVTAEAIHWLGVEVDKTKTRELATTDFQQLTQAIPYDGRLYVLPAVGFEYLLAAAEGRKPEGVEGVDRYQPAWGDGRGGKGMYTSDQLNAGPEKHVARLAIFRLGGASFEPTLHYLADPRTGQPIPYDDYARDQWDNDALTTQLEELGCDQKAFADKHPDLELVATDQKAYLMMRLMDLIRGQNTTDRLDSKSEKFILNKGWMRLPNLGRQKVGGSSFVASVRSGVGQAYFGGGGGNARSVIGVGLSAGRKVS